ncbi:hypothetical protein SAMN02745121_07600 [Nannocystis exedens]|uniref:Uncharacterized protein n=1 Tax=Nannocystis exedens TaxID=54 RepID=A0A1I2GX14_9BACT|nr:hypothetical protein [Nannocystis exedens]PCC68871.1 hypothetical protein NAEX_01891 [Nannocystis exedens]SFF22474.1 hypothetical protein SAMN02745121_07600 [Nannocystis exedens]
MLTLLRSLAGAAATSLVVGACFNPSGQTTDATADPTAPTDSTAATGPASATDSDPTAAPATATSEPTTTTTDPTTQTTAVDTGDGPCPACQAPTPYCAGGGCVGCQDLAAHGLACADLDPAKPHCDAGGECVACAVDDHCGVPLHCDPEQNTCVTCVEDAHCGDTLTCADGQCVGCTVDTQCPAIQPICDPRTQTCRGCRDHGECPDTACELDVGACFPQLATGRWYVDPGVPCAEGDKCVLGNECCSVEQAVERAVADPKPFQIVYIKPGVQARPVHVAVSGKRIALLGEPGVVFTVPTADAVFRVADDVNLQPIDSKLYVSRLYVTKGMPPSVASCGDGGQVWLDEVNVFDVPGAALHAVRCQLTVRRSSFRLVNAGATSDIGGIVGAENSIFGDTLTGAPLQSLGGGKLRLLYTTVVDKGASGKGVLNCLDPASVTIRNSILAGVGGEIQCPDVELTIADTVTTAAGLDGPNITTIGVDSLASIFADYAGGSYHLGPGAALLDHSAVWQIGDPTVDIDGEPRTAVEGAPDFAGADRP